MTRDYRIDGEKTSLHPRRVSQWLDARDDWEKAKDVFPIYVEVSPVGYCNHECTFCGVDYMLDRPDKPQLPAGLMRALLSDLAAQGVLSVMFAGACEPLLYKPLADSIAHADAVGLDTSITTNGVLLTEAFARRALAAPRLRWIKVSINAGTPDVYAAIHRTKREDFDRVLVNLETAVRVRREMGGSCTIGAQMVALPETVGAERARPLVKVTYPSNIATAEPLARRLRDVGVDYLVIKPYSQHLMSEETRVYESTRYEDADGWARRLAALSAPGFDVVVRTRTMAGLTSADRGYRTCHATPYHWAYVEADGEVWGCSAYLGRVEAGRSYGDDRFRYGNLHAASFSDVWRGERRRASWEYVRKELDISQCRKNCRMHHVNEYLEHVVNPGPHASFISRVGAGSSAAPRRHPAHSCEDAPRPDGSKMVNIARAAAGPGRQHARMSRSGRVPLAAGACAVGALLACGGKAGGGETAGGSNSEQSSACDDYFQAILENEACQGNLAPPASELTRIQGRFETLCTQTFALPGSSITASTLEACTAAIKGTCSGGTPQPSVCASLGTGSLASGASCVSGSQCASGSCSAESESADGGTMLCGTCLTPAAVGQSCKTQPCGPNAQCTPGSGGDETCVAFTYGSAGALCNGATTLCNQGLYCDELTDQCAAPGGAGATCEEDEACTPPLVCPSASGPSTCQSPGSAGAPCESDSDCASGLGCTPGAQKCATVTWASAGQPCSDTVRCLVGNCPFANGTVAGTCPTVIPDGQPCDGGDTTSTCDTFANCEGGTCVLGYPSCP